MNLEIKIMEKPDWISWDDIHKVMWEAHAENRNNGVVMRYPSLSGEEIRQRIEGNGKMLVAMDGQKVIGTAALIVRSYRLWCGKCDYAYCCCASVLPEYNGKGIYKALDLKREKLALSMQMTRMLGETHENAKHRLDIAKKAGYKFVDYKYYKDHYDVVMVKWLDGCPYSEFWCKIEFLKRKLQVKMKQAIKSMQGNQS